MTYTRKHATIWLPKHLVDQIDFFLEHQQLGYVSRAEFVKDAVRSLLAKLTQNQPSPPGQVKTVAERGEP
jgi:metal-responsive CopG/Arc/MetJ family transcriptional regulator